MKEIDENKSFYRNFIGQKMAKQLRIIPELNFYLDTTLDDVERIEKELKGQETIYFIKMAKGNTAFYIKEKISHC